MSRDISFANSRPALARTEPAAIWPAIFLLTVINHDLILLKVLREPVSGGLMGASYGVVAATKPLAACVASQLRESPPAARSAAEEIRVGRRLSILSARVRSRLLMGKFSILLNSLVLSTVSSCTSWQAQENTLSQISTLEQMRFAQLLTNLSNELQRPDSIPSLGVTSSGTATTGTMGSLGWNLTNPFDFGHNTKTLSPSVSGNWQNNWTITPISDPQDLANLRSLYGLLYRNDPEIASVIKNTLILYNATSGKVLDIPTLTAKARSDCGISWKPPTVTNPQDAMVAYLEALSAFPDSASSPSASTDSTTQQKKTSAQAKSPTTSVTPSATTEQKNTLLRSKCYGEQEAGVINASLATFYGLAYPSKKTIFFSLRNGLSPDCRDYQRRHLIMIKAGEPVDIRNDRLFERSLFWRDVDGSWKPADQLPSDVFGEDGQPKPGLPAAVFEPLGHYGNFDFWTTASACVSDFIILGINATANSHAAAQNAPKGGTTPTTLGQ